MANAKRTLSLTGVIVLMCWLLYNSQLPGVYTNVYSLPKTYMQFTYLRQGEMEAKNIEEIQKIIKIEKQELANIGIGFRKNAKSVVKSEPKADIELKLTELSTSKIRMHYKHKNVANEFITKLSSEDKKMEIVTDPLEHSSQCKHPVFLLVVVISEPGNKNRREAIRDAWMHAYEDDHAKLKQPKPFPFLKSYAPQYVVKVVFIVGQPKDGNPEEIRKEAALKKDIVFGSMVEDYKNLTLKTRLALKYAHYDCDAAFMLKTDDDVFVNPVPLVEWLKAQQQHQLYTGYCNSNSPVVRNKNSKWYVSESVYSKATYPSYCLGGGYLMSQDVLKLVVEHSYGRTLFPMEDLYVGLITDELKVAAKDQRKHFDLLYSNNKYENDCQLNRLFLLHQVFGEKHKVLRKRATLALSKCSIIF